MSSTTATKTERLLNLVLVLLYTRRALTKAQIRSLVPQYSSTASAEAFERMFERDKEELRELGIPLVTEQVGLAFDEEPAYRIHQRDYALPDIDFAPDELAVLGLASRTWAQASLAGPASAALRKLRAAGVERDAGSLIGLEPRLRTVEAAFEPVRDAVMRIVPIRFEYRRPDDSETTTREVEPWALVNTSGRWYLTGHDRGRDAPRVFRLSRIVGAVTPVGAPGSYAVPEDQDSRAMVGSARRTPPDHAPAVVRVRVGAGLALRRRARTVGSVDEEFDLIDLDYTDVDQLADELAGYGADVVAEQPSELVNGVVQRLQATAQAHRGGVS